MADFAVIGLGAAGSAALAALTHAGVSAIGLDRFAPPHDRGSSHGETRLLRVAYAEGALYVPMARRAIALWRDLEQRSGRAIFHQTGVVYAGPETSPFLTASLASAAAHDVPVDAVTRERRAQMAPALAIPDEWTCVAEREGGYLMIDAAIGAFLAEAESHGASVRRNTPVLGIELRGDGVRIRTEGGDADVAHCIVTGGAWTAELLPALALDLRVERKTLHWFADPRGLYRPGAFAPFLIDDENGHQVYGFPDCASGVKIAEHSEVANAQTHPDEIARDISARDTDNIAVFVARFCPGAGERLRSTTCLYPMSKDGHFIIDTLPGSGGRIVLAAGLSGHGFKFAPVIGEAAANLALDRPQAVDVAPFSLSRF